MTLPASLAAQFQQRLPTVEPGHPRYATELVAAVLSGAREAGASDIHLLPGEHELSMAWRVDGVLQPIATFPRRVSANVVARLKVLADLLTYQCDVPQEGRIREGDADVEMRLSTFPTLFGEKAVVRLFVGSGRYRQLDDLGLPADVRQTLGDLLRETGGVILLTGPAGSGKTTTVYACLREIMAQSPLPRSLASLEDPVEAVLPGVAQSQIQPHAGFDYAVGLRSLLRQDPEVVLVGEVRDRETAETVFQAALTGTLVVTTFHAGSTAEALARLADMGIEPYLLRTGLLAVVCQRLVRRLCDCAAAAPAGTEPDAAGAGAGETGRTPVGCPRCRGTGYDGRAVLAELLRPDAGTVGRAILARSDADEIERCALESGMIDCRTRAREAVRNGITSRAEISRVIGVR